MRFYNENIEVKTSNSIKEVAILIILSVFGVAISLFYGRMGFMPLDHSVTFDGGWRILSGQLPFRDFTTPHSIIPIMLQALLFKILGVNWFAYCVHAAILNGLFCIVVYYFLKLLGGTRILASFYALLSGVIFYPPYGVPLMDCHSFFFVMLSIVLLNIAITSKNKITSIVSGYLIIPVMFLAYLSKQSAALLGSLILCGILVIKIKEVTQCKIIFRMITSGLLCLVLILLFVVIYRLDWHQIKVYAFELPALTGMDRFSAFTAKWAFTFRYVTLSVAKYSIITAQFFICILILLGTLIKKNGKRELFFNIVLAESLFLFCILFSDITMNQIEGNVPFLFIFVGITHISLIRTFNNIDDPIPREVFIFFISVLLAGLSLFDAYRFNLNVNATREVNDISFKRELLKQDRNLLPPNLSFIIWQVPDSCKFSARDFGGLIKFLEENPGNFYLFGDSSILYGLTNRPSVSPSLFFTRRLTIPPKMTKEFIAYQRRIIQNLKKYKVRFIITEGDETWMKCRLRDFKQLDNFVKEKCIFVKSFGGFKVFELISQNGASKRIEEQDYAIG